jgi:L-lactate dehydrogenase complex protein LldE
VCTAGDSSCLMHIGGGLSRLRAGVRTVHLAEILASTEQGTPARDIVFDTAEVGESKGVHP